MSVKSIASKLKLNYTVDEHFTLNGIDHTKLTPNLTKDINTNAEKKVVLYVSQGHIVRLLNYALEVEKTFPHLVNYVSIVDHLTVEVNSYPIFPYGVRTICTLNVIENANFLPKLKQSFNSFFFPEPPKKHKSYIRPDEDHDKYLANLAVFVGNAKISHKDFE